MFDWFLTGLGWFTASAVGGFATYLYTQHHDKVKEQKEARNKLNATCHSVCFYLAMQQSELGGLLKDVKYRIKQLENINNNTAPTREQMVAALQDFVFYKEINVSIEKISEVILPAGNDQRGIVETLNCIFISNKKYNKTLNSLDRFNEAKRLMNKDKNINLTRLLRFAEVNLPEYMKEIEQNMAFISQSLEAFKAEVKTKFNIVINLSVGEFVKLN